MSNKSAYTYTVLRYMHDMATGEFLNAGVALLAPEHPDESSIEQEVVRETQAIELSDRLAAEVRAPEKTLGAV